MPGRRDPVSGSAFTELAWAAGLFTGEGSTAAHKRVRKDGGGHLYLRIGMYDKRALDRFCNAVRGAYVTYHQTHTGRQFQASKPIPLARVVIRGGVQKTLWEVCLGAGPALAVLRALWPYLDGTDKGDQLLRAMTKAHIAQEEVTCRVA